MLMTDVVGYGAHISRGEEDSESRIAADLSMFSDRCELHKGRVVCDRGDGLKMLFESPVEAMRAALEMQKEVFQRNSELDPTRKIVRHRMGLHLGDVLFADERPTGYAVAIAARLEQSASPGEVCISDEIYRAVRHAVTFPCRFVGREELKNLRDPVKMWMTMREDPLAMPHRHVTIVSSRSGPARTTLGPALFATVVLGLVAAAFSGLVMEGGLLVGAPQPPVSASADRLTDAHELSDKKPKALKRGRKVESTPVPGLPPSDGHDADDGNREPVQPAYPRIPDIVIPPEMGERERAELEAYRKSQASGKKEQPEAALASGGETKG